MINGNSKLWGVQKNENGMAINDNKVENANKKQ